MIPTSKIINCTKHHSFQCWRRGSILANVQMKRAALDFVKGRLEQKGNSLFEFYQKRKFLQKGKNRRALWHSTLPASKKCWKQVTVTYFFRLKNKEQLLGSLFGPCQSPLLCWYFLYVVQLGRIFKGEMGEINLSAGSTLTFKGKVRSKRLYRKQNSKH